MVAALYEFRTVFALPAAVGEVRRAIMEPERWLDSWAQVRELRRLEDGAADGIGRRYRTTVRAVAPYTLSWEMEVVRADEGLVVWEATGDLEGNGRWILRQRGSNAEVDSTWLVRTNRWWMKLSTPLARPLFVVNHDAVMRRGAHRLAAHLGSEVVAYEGHDVRRHRQPHSGRLQRVR